MALKSDYPPLLAPGRHFMTLPRLESLCARAFDEHTPDVRMILFLRLEALVQALLVAKIRCDVYVNGSFLTRKPAPGDVDVIVTVEHAIYESLSEGQMSLLDGITQGDFGADIDATAWVEYPREHEHHGSALDGSFAFEGFGVEHSQQWLKGFAVIRLWEADVRNRFCR